MLSGMRNIREYDDRWRGSYFTWKRVSALTVILMLGTAAWGSRLNNQLTFDDELRYMVLGKSLSEGGYRDLELPGEPRHVALPPGYSLIIAAVLRGLGAPPLEQAVIPLKMLNLIFLLGSVVLILSLQRRLDRPLVVLGGLFLFVFNPLTVEMAGSVLSEVPYLFFSLLGILAFERLVLADSSPPTGRILCLLLAAAALAWPVYIRVIGIGLGAAAVGSLLVQRRRRAACVVCGLWLAMLLPLLLVYGGRPGAGYVDDWFLKDVARDDVSPLTAAAVLTRLAVNVTTYVKMLPDVIFFSGKYGRPILPLAVTLFGGCALIGLVGGIRPKRPFRELYLALYALILVAWTAREPRYLFPVFPLLQLYAVRGAVSIAERLARAVRMRHPERIGVAALTAVLVGALASGVYFHRREAGEVAHAETDGGWLKSRWEAIHWIGTTARHGAITMLRKPKLLYVYTGRKGVLYPWTGAEEVIRRIEAYHVEYILEDPSARTKTFLRPALTVLSAQGRIELAYETSGEFPNRVWRVRRGAGTLARGPSSES